LALKRLPDGRWRLPGRLPLNEAVEWVQSIGGPVWKPGQAETLAGWLLEQLDTIPEGTCCLSAAGLQFEIETMEGMAIESVLVRVPQTMTGAANA
jgi:CBS domain containing-hemolysin-like protein